MKLSTGMCVGPYEIESPLGAGGMGEVFRGKDTRLNRSVAIKVLPEIFLKDSNRLMRFGREAKVLASLNHSNIASIHGFEEFDGMHLLVMELVEGLTLAEVIAKNTLPTDEALAIASQVAEALEYAHEQGVIHRDLKPANIKLRPDGTVKILDFGLAKAVQDENVPNDVSISPTISHHATEMGMILGTAAYMSPEQAKGKPVDRRADIWSFGVILYEMLTGQKPFRGETISETLASVLKEEPDLKQLPAEVPERMRHLVRRCLMKDPKQRLRDIGDARLEIQECKLHPEVTPDLKERFETPSLSSRMIPWAIAALLALTIILTKPWNKQGDVNTGAVQRFAITFPPETPLVHYSSGVQLSPDGSSMAFITGTPQRRNLSQRHFSQEKAVLISGSDGASEPFFSPDGKRIAFFANGFLKHTSTFGEQVETLCTATNARGGVWATDGNIYFTPTTDSSLMRISAVGGTPETVTDLNVSAGERSHRWPDMLPDGKTLLFTIAYTKGSPLDDASIAVQEIGKKPHKILIKGGGFGRYVSTGHIVYARQNNLYAVPFDIKQLKIAGPTFRVQDGVAMSQTNGAAQFSFAKSGSLIYSAGEIETASIAPLLQIQRNGTESTLINEKRGYWYARYTRNGRYLLLEIDDPASAVWIYDLTRGTMSLITSAALGYMPVPSPDNQYVAFESVRDGAAGIFVSKLDGTGEIRISSTKEQHIPTSWTPDAQSILLTSGIRSGYSEIRMISLKDKTEKTVLKGVFNVGAGMLSPDGKWLAYVSDESKRNEVYIRPFQGDGPKLQVSIDGGTQPMWAPSGRELFYRNGKQLLVVDVNADREFTTGRPRLLFSRHNPLSNSGYQYDIIANYDVSPDGKSFAMPNSVEIQTGAPTAHIVLNWFQEIQRFQKTPPQ